MAYEKIKEVLENIFNDASNNFRYAFGIKRFEYILSKNPNFFDEKSFCRLGLLYDHLALQKKTHSAQYEEKALHIYKKVLRKNSNSYRAVWGIGRVWWHRGKNKRALPYAIRSNKLARRSGAKTGISTQTVGLVYEYMGDYINVEKWLLQGMREEPKEWGVYLNLVNFYRLIHNFKDAKKMARKLERLFQKETKKIKTTLWGTQIKKIIKNAGTPLEKIKKVTL